MHTSHLRPLRCAVACAGTALLLTLGSCERADSGKPASGNAAAASGAFEGTWNAAGTRRTIALGDNRTAATIDVRGSMLLSGAGRPGAGFGAQLVALTDSQTGMIGRAVWTDEHDDQVFSELKGEGTKEHNRITGTIIGGTGRYAGVTGTYEFSWEFLIESEDGAIQGRATGLKGTYSLARGEKR